jgi:hypothetical protein
VSKRRRAGDAQALSNSEVGGAIFAAAMAASQKPRRHKARFKARIFRAAHEALFRTRLSAHIADATTQAGTPNRHAYVNWRA